MVVSSVARAILSSYRAVLVVMVMTAVVPGVGETAIISGNDNQRLTFKMPCSIGEFPTAEYEN
jgi:hypothetical protein